MLEWLLPKHLEIDLNDPEYMEEFVWWMHNQESEHIYQILKDEGFSRIRNDPKEVDETVRVTFDENDLVKFENLLQQPGMKTKKLYA